MKPAARQLTDGVDHWFIVDRPEATVALIEALTSKPLPHPAVVERRRRDTGRGSPTGALWSQMFFVGLLLVEVVSRVLGPRANIVFAVLDVVILCILGLLTGWTLYEMWRYRRYRLSP